MKLTNATRDHIVSAAMQQAFEARDKAQEKAITALADAVYEHEYAAIGQIANKLPQGWCNAHNRIYINAPGFSWRGDNDDVNECLGMSKSRRLPMNQNCKPVKIGGAHPLNDQAQVVAEENKAIGRDKNALRAKLRAVVYATTTVEKLLEAWPECEALLPACTPKPAGALVPVELVPELNKALGIKAKAPGSEP